MLAFWHGEQLAMIPAHAGRSVVAMVSLSDDGALLAAVLERLGYDIVRGSSSRGGAGALRRCARAMREGSRSCGLAVDGPRGPFHAVHPGAVALAALTGCPVVYAVVVRASRAWVVGSWDRFQIPLPFSEVAIRYGAMRVAWGADVGAAAAALRARMEALAAQPLSDRESTLR